MDVRYRNDLYGNYMLIAIPDTEDSTGYTFKMLDKNKIAYSVFTYDASDGVIDGVSVAGKVGQDAAFVYKTLVTQGKSNNYFVF